MRRWYSMACVTLAAILAMGTPPAGLLAGESCHAPANQQMREHSLHHGVSVSTPPHVRGVASARKQVQPHCQMDHLGIRILSLSFPVYVPVLLQIAHAGDQSEMPALVGSTGTSTDPPVLQPNPIYIQYAHLLI